MKYYSIKNIENKFLLCNHVNVFMSGLTSRSVTSCQDIPLDDLTTLDDVDYCFYQPLKDKIMDAASYSECDEIINIEIIVLLHIRSGR